MTRPLLRRHAQESIAAALADTRVVLVQGARQSGKSTLARLVADRPGGRWTTLDRAQFRQAAQADPDGFVHGDWLPLVVDEVQRVPELLLSIKAEVDENPQPGRFLLTGSARVLSMRGVADALPGRMETIELWPLSQGEIDQTPDGFVDAVLTQGPDVSHDSDETRDGYLRRLARGGFPEMLSRTDMRARRYLDQYLADLVNRDAIQVLAVERPAELRTLIRLVAGRSGQLLVPHQLSQRVPVASSTVAQHIAALEEVFLIKRIPAWSRGTTRRAVGTPKVAFVDSGVAARQLNASATSLADPGSPLGGLLEGFVAMEIARQLTWSEQDAELFHYRTRDGLEVDIVLESPTGQIVGIEVKAAMSVQPADFRGLRHLAERVGDDMLVGIVLYLGHETLSFGPRLRAMPVASLWQM